MLLAVLWVLFVADPVRSEGRVYVEGVDEYLVTSCLPPTQREDEEPISEDELDHSEIVLFRSTPTSPEARVIEADIRCMNVTPLSTLEFGQWYKTARIQDTEGLWSELSENFVPFEWNPATVTPPVSNLPAIPRDAWTATASSHEVENWLMPPEHAFDGDPATLWHTQYTPVKTQLPGWIDIDTGAGYAIGGFRYLPRSSGGNGTIGQYEFYVSRDGLSWGKPVAAGEFPINEQEKEIQFPPVIGRFVRFAAYSSRGDEVAAVAELTILGVAVSPPLPPGLK
jgi:hypothetical protein